MTGDKFHWNASSIRKFLARFPCAHVHKWTWRHKFHLNLFADELGMVSHTEVNQLLCDVLHFIFFVLRCCVAASWWTFFCGYLFFFWHKLYESAISKLCVEMELKAEKVWRTFNQTSGLGTLITVFIDSCFFV